MHMHLVTAGMLILGAGVLVALMTAETAQARSATADTGVTHRTVNVDGRDVFVREAGPKEGPAVLLLHGFPASSHMFRELMPLLADRYHVVAPDLPGFGFSEAPSRAEFAYTFDSLTKIVDRLTEVLGLRRYALYVFDYGAPIGFRLALAHPDRITAIITQNGNAYEEGLGEQWKPIRAYWSEPTVANRAALRSLLTPEATKWQFVHGADDEAQVAPESYILANALLARPGNEEIQLDLFLDYASNVALYPKFHEFFRTRQPPLLAVWGSRDEIFLPAGAKAFRRDLPAATIKLYDAGHFALETHAKEIGAAVRQFLDATGLPRSVSIDSSDLDLSQPGAVSTLYGRIRSAARRVCNPQNLDLYLPVVRGYGECYRLTVADAVARIPRPVP